MTLHVKMADTDTRYQIPDTRYRIPDTRYTPLPLSLYMNINVEDIVVFLGLKLFKF